ncbi:uncharacterized protein LOC125192860 isoform X2 [Salvia hispanica]|uniref:uncharacterized protein LOC125192860 isoform X2 n=1 Tax=Salvia hispanica TaxID=49212 RepID=UPI0020090C04|nr:uncharacterized protein LOC125192860 isoform X2 [Salvia hispanica]
MVLFSFDFEQRRFRFRLRGKSIYLQRMGKKLKSSSSSPRDESMSKSRRSHSSSEHHSGFDNFVGQKGQDPARPESWPVETDNNTPSYPLTESNDNVEDYEISDDKRFTTEETKLLAYICIDVSKDQRADFWWDVATNYNEFTPVGALYRYEDELREHWVRMQKDVSKFIDIFTNCQKMQGSGHSLDDICQQAKDAFFSDEGRNFEYEDVWAIMRSKPKLFSGFETSCGPKKARVSTSGQDSTSGASIAPAAQDPQLDEYSARMEKAGSQGTPPPSLMSIYLTATMADTSRMTPEQYQAHFAGIAYLARQLGIPPQTVAPPPPSGG